MGIAVDAAGDCVVCGGCNSWFAQAETDCFGNGGGIRFSLRQSAGFVARRLVVVETDLAHSLGSITGGDAKPGVAAGVCGVCDRDHVCSFHVRPQSRER